MDTVNPIICGRRNCAKCGRWKLAVDYKWRWNKRRVPNVNKNAKTKTRSLRSRYPTPVVDSICKTCRRQESRDRYRNMSAEQKRALQIRANTNATKLRAKWHAEIQAARMSIENHRELFDDENLDIVPFRMWVLGQIRIHTATGMAQRIGVGEDRIRHLADGYYWPNERVCDEPVPMRTVRLSTVDTYGTRMGDPGLLDRLYPYIEE